MATSTSNAPAQGKQTAPAMLPFRAGVQDVTTQDGYQVTQALGTTSVPLTIYNPSNTVPFLRGLYIQANCTGTNSSATTAFAADGPWNVYSTVQFNDVNGKPIILVNGYELMLINKLGGYGLVDPRGNATYTNTTGNHSAGGSFEFVLYVPLEIVNRTALGALVNKNESSPFQLLLTVNTLGNVYSTAPDGGASLVTVVTEDGYWQPQTANIEGAPLRQNPDNNGTTQYWTKTSYNMANGYNSVRITGGMGSAIRNIVFENYAVSGARATGTTDMPDPTMLTYQGTTLKNVGKNVWQNQMCNWFGLTSTGTASGAVTPTYDSAAGLENGIFVLPFNIDFDNRPGDELCRGYLVTQLGDNLSIAGTWGGACTLYELVNYIAPATTATALLSSM